MNYRMFILRKICLGLTFVLISTVPFIEISNSFITQPSDFNTSDFVDFLLEPAFESIHYLFGKTSTWRESFEIEGESVICDSTGNSFFTGTIKTDFEGNSDICLGKINATGSIEWITIHNYLLADFAYDLCFDNYTNLLYVVGATSNSSRMEYTDLLVGCYDATTGLEIWNNTFGEEFYSEIGYSVEYYSNRLFVSGIETQYLDIDTDRDIILVCFDTFTGLSIWSKSLASEYYEHNPKIAFDLENEEFFLVLNRRNNSNSVDFHQYSLQKYTLNGNKTWETNSTLESNIIFNDFTVDFLNEHLYIVGDTKNSKVPTIRDTIITKYDLNGELINSIIYGTKDYDEIGLAIEVDVEQNVIISGYVTSNLFNENVIFMTKLDSSGEIIWSGKNEKYLRGQINSLKINSNGYIVVVGFVEGKYDYIFQRLFVSFSIDEDDDNLSTLWELEIGTNPTIFDTDSDGFSDGHEYLHNTDPLDKFSNYRNRKSLYTFGITLTFLVVFIFIIVNFFSKKTAAAETTPIIKLFDKIKSKFKREKRQN